MYHLKDVKKNVSNVLICELTYVLPNLFTCLSTYSLTHSRTYFLPRDEALSGSELTSKLEPAFLAGLRCQQPQIRQKFVDVFDGSIKKRIYDRLLYIVCSQNWEAMAGHFWIKQCIEVGDLLVLFFSLGLYCYLGLLQWLSMVYRHYVCNLLSSFPVDLASRNFACQEINLLLHL